MKLVLGKIFSWKSISTLKTGDKQVAGDDKQSRMWFVKIEGGVHELTDGIHIL